MRWPSESTYRALKRSAGLWPTSLRKVHPSALKHGVSPEDAVQAAEASQWIEPLEDGDWPHRELRVGFDTQARLLETVVLIFDSGDELLIHAMPARTQYWDLLS